MEKRVKRAVKVMCEDCGYEYPLLDLQIQKEGGDVLVARLSRCHGGPAREAGGALSRLADGAAAAFNREG